MRRCMCGRVHVCVCVCIYIYIYIYVCVCVCACQLGFLHLHFYKQHVADQDGTITVSEGKTLDHELEDRPAHPGMKQ